MIEYYKFQNIAGNQLPPFHDFFCTEKPLFKIVFGQNFFKYPPIAHFRTNKASNFAKIIFCLQLN